MFLEQLLSYAWNLSQIVPRDLEDVNGIEGNPNGSQGSDALFWFNQLLSEEGIDSQTIPFYDYIFLNTVVGQEMYFVPNVTYIETLTFNIGPIRYSMKRDNRRHYFGAPRVDNILALPFYFYSERNIQDGISGTELSLYWLPQAVYQLKLKCQIGLSQVTTADLSLDLNTIYDPFYQTYLMYKLADRLCEWYGISFPPKAQETLRMLTFKLTNLNPRDLTLSKTCTAAATDTMTYAQANLGKGWISPS
jgi:hypothetical protein